MIYSYKIRVKIQEVKILEDLCGKNSISVKNAIRELRYMKRQWKLDHTY